MNIPYNENWEWEYDDENQKVKFSRRNTNDIILEVNYKQFRTMFKIIENNIEF